MLTLPIAFYAIRVSGTFALLGYEFDGMKCDYELYDEYCMDEKGNVCDICIPVVKKET
jgi:predicted transcriptional regulator YdeE